MAKRALYLIPQIKNRSYPKALIERLVGVQPMGDCNTPKQTMAQKVHIPEWAKHADTVLNNSRRFDVNELEIDGIAALSDNGQLVPANDPSRDDIWFVFADLGKCVVLIYNGKSVFPCKLDRTLHPRHATVEEIWIDVKRYAMVFDNERKAMDEKIAEYIDQF